MEKAKALFRKILKKVFSREFITYGIFGVLTTLVNILLFDGGMVLGITYSLANLIAILGAKVFAYVTNKRFAVCRGNPSRRRDDFQVCAAGDRDPAQLRAQQENHFPVRKERRNRCASGRLNLRKESKNSDEK